MDDDLEEGKVSLSSLPQYTLVHDLTSYNFLIFRHNVLLYIHPTKARSEIVKMHPELSAIIPTKNFARDMKKLPAALLNVSLIGRTKKENKSEPVIRNSSLFPKIPRRCHEKSQRYCIVILCHPVLSPKPFAIHL